MDGDEGDFFFDQAEVEAGLDVGAQERLTALEDRLQLPTAEQFQEMVAEDDCEAQDDEQGQSTEGKSQHDPA